MEDPQLEGTFPPPFRSHHIFISSIHLARVSRPSIPVCPILFKVFNNGILIRHSEQADPDVDYSWPQSGGKLYASDRDLDHLP